MRFQLRGHGWSVDGGRLYLPEGAIIDTADPGSAALMARNGSIPPSNAMPLDENTFALMRRHYEPHQIFTIGMKR